MEIVIASTNAHKIQEYNEMVKGYQIKFLSLNDINFKDEIIEDGKTFKENSLIKAKTFLLETLMSLIVFFAILPSPLFKFDFLLKTSFFSNFCFTFYLYIYSNKC